MAAVLVAASYSRGGFSPCFAVSARRVMVPGGSTFHLEPGTIPTILSISLDSKINESVNQPRYGRVYNWNYSQILSCHNNWIINFLRTEQMKKIRNTLIELFSMIVWWTCLWSLRKVNMVIFMLIIIHVIVTILSNFLHIHITFKQTWVLMVKLFLLVKWYVR